ncbi:unnamed protein product [Plutella xylostella]|uniref:(diamondback moth) hypothetical protein n=1 Tax=Plutella xylostella TaxID=51655 RepID=A0A8S4G175_PLUXY|nr:unnamed protein product [Plutella xylostella]
MIPSVRVVVWGLVCCCLLSQFGLFVSGYEDSLATAHDNTAVWRQRRRGGGRAPACQRQPSYVCEEPPNTIPASSGKYCDFRNDLHPEQVYRWVAGRGCLRFTPDQLFVGGRIPFDLRIGCFYGEHFAPCLELEKEDGKCGCYPYDPRLEQVTQAVRAALLPSARGRWEQCVYEAEACCDQYMNKDMLPAFVLGRASGTCRGTWDGWSCWAKAEAGSVVAQVCPDFAYSNSGPSCEHYSSKQCNPNGTWSEQTDYSTCSVAPRLLRRYRFHIAILATSIAACVPAVLVFVVYRRLRVTRVALHRNLLIAIIVRNVAVIVSRTEIYIDELSSSTTSSVLSANGVGCRILAALERASVNAVFVCMLIEGVYLHRLIVAVFKKKISERLLYGVGAVITIVPVIIWAALMAVYNDHSCWVVYSVANIQWVLDAPRIAILLVNTLLFLDILRALLTAKIRNAESTNQLNTTKATLFLMPLFGTQFLLTAFRPQTASCVLEQAYYYCTYSLESLQGAVVALLYCYANKEVHNLVKATYKKTEESVVSIVNRDGNYRRATKAAFSSSAHSSDKELYPRDNPALHTAEIISINPSERFAEILEPVYETVVPCVNEGYDSLDRMEVELDARKVKSYDSSSGSFEVQDWVGDISAGSSSCEGSLDYNGLDDKCGHGDAELDRFSDACERNPRISTDSMMFDEIMQIVEFGESSGVLLDPSLLSPNRKTEDKIVFLDN